MTTSPADSHWLRRLNKELPFPIPDVLVRRCVLNEERVAWLHTLPHTVNECLSRWSATPHALLGEHEGTCSYVVKVRLPNGEFAVAKFAFPHMEGKHEIAGLRFWHGDGVVRVYAADGEHWALLLEYCSPGTSLRQMPEPKQDVIIARLLRRLWKKPLHRSHAFRSLDEMLRVWFAEARQNEDSFCDPGLMRTATHMSRSLCSVSTYDALLATDLHAGNVLKSDREPWLVIDPKPFVGDTAYDATQHVLSCMPRLIQDPERTIGRFADMLEVDARRIRQWLFIRLVVEAAWEGRVHDAEKKQLIRQLAP